MLAPEFARFKGDIASDQPHDHRVHPRLNWREG
jgi:hypothetical protein